jgi:glycosyltransferase involved in cell wall biosynthesis
MKKMIFCHLLNDASGSPRVLRGVIKAINGANGNAKLFVGTHGRGVLEGCGIPISRYWYLRSTFRVITLFTFLLSQVLLFIALVRDRSIDKNAIIYVNTLLPFGGALFGKLTGRKVIYHVHEISIQPKLLCSFLCGVVRLTSSINIYVSKAHALALPIAGVPAIQIYNSLDNEFSLIASNSYYKHRRDGIFNVLMIASLRDYKGIPELLNLITELEDRIDILFELVVNDEQMDIDKYFSGKILPTSLIIYPRTIKMAYFYQRASLVLNLTRVDLCIETFGLTILESISFGVPVIVPPVGGPAELVSDAIEGFIVDSRNTTLLKEKIILLADNASICQKMSRSARLRAQDFSPQVFASSILDALQLSSSM